MQIIRIVFTSFLLVIFPMNIIGQQVLTQYSIKDGLPSSEVYDVFESKSGHIYFLTDKGISKYNGYEFENYSSINGLSENIYFKSCTLENGDVMIYGMEHHVDYISTADGRFYPYPYNDTLNKYARGIITNFVFTKNKHLLVNYYNKAGYLEIDGKGNVISLPIELVKGELLRYYQHPVFSEFLFIDFFDHNQYSAASDIFKADNIYKPTYYGKKGSLAYSISPHEIVTLVNGDTSHLKLEHPYVEFGKIDDRTFWYSQQNRGVYFIDAKGKELNYFLNGYSISDVLFDSNGMTWFTTLNDGLFVLPEYARQIPVTDQPTGYVRSISSDKKGNIFVSLENGAVCKSVKSSLKTLYKSNSDRFAVLNYSNRLDAVLAFVDNEIIDLNTQKKSVTSFKGTPSRMMEVSPSQIGMSGYFGFALVDSNFNKTSSNAPRKCTDFELYNNTLYISTKSGLYSSTDNTFLDFKVNENINTRINCLESANEFLLCGTNGEGILVLREDSIVGQIKPDVLGTGFVNELKCNEAAHELWVGTNSGLVLLKILKDSITQTKVKNLSPFLPNKEVTAIHIYHDTAWIGTKGGLYIIDKALLSSKRRDIHHHLHIDKVIVNDIVRYNYSALDLAYNENRVEISFSGINLIPRTDLQYRYKLIGATKHWSYTKKRSVQYPNLSPGKYIFKVEVADNNGQYGREAAKMSIIIHPPFWQTWWFRISLAGLITLIIYLFFRFRILLYNRDLVREILRQIMKKLKKQTRYITVKESGSEVKILTGDILFVKSDGNYLEIHTEKGKHVIRGKISNFLELVPDPLEFLRVRRSYIVRIDKITQKGKKHLMINDHKIDVGETYLKTLQNIHL